MHLNIDIYVAFTALVCCWSWHLMLLKVRNQIGYSDNSILTFLLAISGLASNFALLGLVIYVWVERGFLSALALGMVGFLAGSILGALTSRSKNETSIWHVGVLAFWPLAVGVFVLVRNLPPLP